MVWSSAQPPSVKDMVQRCFGDRHGELKAVWARDTLDLDPIAYHKKSITIKDLNKLWKTFSSHSAKTTLLVDDSTQKARLQPWNHIFVKEYGHAERQSDLSHLWGSSHPDKKKQDDVVPDVSDLFDNLTLSPSVLKTSLAPPPSSDAFDSILLAVIGILDAVKYQDNVSGWLKSGGIVLCGAEGMTGGGGGIIGDRWFDTVHIVNWWANKGRAALAELNIDEVAGLVANKILITGASVNIYDNRIFTSVGGFRHCVLRILMWMIQSVDIPFNFEVIHHNTPMCIKGYWVNLLRL
ncbi:phosphoprotein phosphatase [Lentinula edodes]|uniref:Phosphoprotein phosphatase n=1 Tax=Lentinula edodes TaxID=5353 RepID=A0A1Q3E742_LENED|nr:phosphoprotein phosphatase [Lentinula edodes]